MTRIKQKTVGGQTIELVELQEGFVIRDADTKQRIEDPFRTKSRAIQEFRETVRLVEKGQQAETSGGPLLGAEDERDLLGL